MRDDVDAIELLCKEAEELLQKVLRLSGANDNTMIRKSSRRSADALVTRELLKITGFHGTCLRQQSEGSPEIAEFCIPGATYKIVGIKNIVISFLKEFVNIEEHNIV